MNLIFSSQTTIWLNDVFIWSCDHEVLSVPQLGRQSHQSPSGFIAVPWKRACWDSALTAVPYKRRDDSIQLILELQSFVSDLCSFSRDKISSYLLYRTVQPIGLCMCIKLSQWTYHCCHLGQVAEQEERSVQCASTGSIVWSASSAALSSAVCKGGSRCSSVSSVCSKYTYCTRDGCLEFSVLLIETRGYFSNKPQESISELLLQRMSRRQINQAS